MDKKKAKMDCLKKRSGKKYRDGGRKYDDSDFSEEEKREARKRANSRKSPFTRPGDTSNFQKRKTTLQSIRDYFYDKPKKK